MLRKIFLPVFFLIFVNTVDAQYIFPLNDTTFQPAICVYENTALSDLCLQGNAALIQKPHTNTFILLGNGTYTGTEDRYTFANTDTNSHVNSRTVAPFRVFNISRYAQRTTIGNAYNTNFRYLKLNDIRTHNNAQLRTHELMLQNNIIWSLTDTSLYCSFIVDDTAGYRYDSLNYLYNSITLDAAGNLYVLRVGIHHYKGSAPYQYYIGSTRYYTTPYIATQVYRIAHEDLRHVFEDTQKFDKRLPATLVAGRRPAPFDFRTRIPVSPDGTAAADMVLALPYDIDVDASGSIYICDGGYNQVRKIAFDDAGYGVLSTVAGRGGGIPSPNNNNDSILFWGAFSGDGGNARDAELYQPRAVSVHPRTGDVYITDYGNARIRVVDAASGIIRTFLGGDSFLYYGDYVNCSRASTVFVDKIQFDTIGNIYFKDGKTDYRIAATTYPLAGLGYRSQQSLILRKVCLYPTRITIAAAGSNCAGNPVTLRASVTDGIEPLPYVWVRNGVPTGDTGKTYTFTPQYGDSVYCYVLSGLHACADSTHVVSNIVTYTRPVCSLSAANNGIVTEGSTCTFTAASNQTGGIYRWFVNNIEITGVSTATYTYLPADGDRVFAIWQRAVGCAADTVYSNGITIRTVPVSVSDQSIEPVSLYPNPAATHIYLNNSSRLQARLRSMDGKVQWEGSIAPNAHINIQSFPAGMYLLELRFGDGSRKRLKWVKE